MKRVEINEKVGVSADFVTILEQGIGYIGAEREKNASAFEIKRKYVLLQTQGRLIRNARAFSGSSGKEIMTGCRGWQAFL